MDKHRFVQFLIDQGVLLFGDFTTKSGRQSPYFLNFGNLFTGSQLNTLTEAYCTLILKYFGTEFTNLFGPAYKGIPLGTAIACCLQKNHNLDISVSFNRKETKDHGERGRLLGYGYYSHQKEPEKTIIVEDVTTAGTSIREVMPLLESFAQVKVEGLVVAVDRKEKGPSGRGALAEISENYGVKVHSIVDIYDVYGVLTNKCQAGEFPQAMLIKMEKYISEYGAPQS